MRTRAEIVQLIAEKRTEMKKAGPIHARDTARFIKKLERDLHDYDRFQRLARAAHIVPRSTPN